MLYITKALKFVIDNEFIQFLLPVFFEEIVGFKVYPIIVIFSSFLCLFFEN